MLPYSAVSQVMICEVCNGYVAAQWRFGCNHPTHPNAYCCDECRRLLAKQGAPTVTAQRTDPPVWGNS